MLMLIILHVLFAVAKIITHLVNQQSAHEILALKHLILLLEKLTHGFVEVVAGLVLECGSLLHCKPLATTEQPSWTTAASGNGAD
jgi:hypothetical protein